MPASSLSPEDFKLRKLFVSESPRKQPKLEWQSELGMHMWNERLHGDFTIICRNSEKLKVHKVVLTSSPVMKSMIYGNFQEAESGKMTMMDIDAYDLESVMRFVYTAKLPEETNLPVVLQFADKYQMETLVLRCCAEMLAQLSPHNVSSFVRALRVFESEPMNSTFKIISELIRRNSHLCLAVLRHL